MISKTYLVKVNLKTAIYHGEWRGNTIFHRKWACSWILIDCDSDTGNIALHSAVSAVADDQVMMCYLSHTDFKRDLKSEKIFSKKYEWLTQSDPSWAKENIQSDCWKELN